MTIFKSSPLVLAFIVACSSDEAAMNGTPGDASAGGTAGTSGASSGGGGAGKGGGGVTSSGGRSTGGVANASGGSSGSSGSSGAAGSASSGGAAGATDGGRDASASGGSSGDAAPTDGGTNVDAAVSNRPEASCRGAAQLVCQAGTWHEYESDGGARCAACPGPTLTCASFDLAASTFTKADPKRIIKVALAPGAAEVLMDDDVRMTATFEGTSCGGSHTVSTFGKNRILVEHDAAGRTFFSVDIGIINSTMVPCGDFRIVFNDGCCTAQEAHVSAVYDDGSGTTTFSCPDGG